METQIRLLIERRDLFAEGISFGATGLYEYLKGRVYFYVDPFEPTQKLIIDIEKAPRNPDGRVEFYANFYILKPLDMTCGNHRLLYHVCNRGNSRVLRTFNDAILSNQPFSAAHAGNGFLMRRGYTILWSGWQGDILPGDGRMALAAPVATEQGRNIVNMVRLEFIADAPDIFSFPLRRDDFARCYETATLDISQSIFTCRQYEKDSRVSIPLDEWQFARAEKDSQSGKWYPVSSTTDCYLSTGFRPGWIYELIYPAKNPLIIGLGFVSVRELVSFFRYANADMEGNPNILKEKELDIEKAYAWGSSQSGRFLREFVYRGFNEDEKGHRVFDAIFPHSAGGGRMILNYRFAQPGRASWQHEDHLYPSDLFPFSYASIADPLTGKTDAILKRPKSDPLVIETQNPVDYWERRASLVHTDYEGKDINLPENVRVYLIASTSSHPLTPEEERICKYHPHIPFLFSNAISKALLDLLDRWASGGTPPPDSRIPKREDGTLVTATEVQVSFPQIPGVACPAEPNHLQLLYYGPDMERGLISQHPPRLIEGKEYAVLVPQVDSDGNDIPGLRPPEIVVPLATHTGWNLRAEGFSSGALANLMGSYFPFARTEEERKAKGDPRPSIQERYRYLAGYVRAVARAVEKLVDEGFLLEEDADRYIEEAMHCKFFPESK